MSDLIDRQAAIDYISRALPDWSEGKEVAIDCLSNLPAVDAVPVRRGKWIIYVVSPFDGEDVKCSECGERGCASYWDYCPNCGARMEEQNG